MSEVTGNEQQRLHEAQIDLEANRIEWFSGMLDRVGEVKAVVPDTDFSSEDSDPLRSAQKRFVTFGYEGEPTLYVNPELGIAVEGAELAFTPLMSRSGKRSRHGVFFGSLEVNGRTMDVAVKPHIADVEQTTFANLEPCVNDYFVTHEINERGIYTPRPAAILLGDSDASFAYSMTVLEEGLTTLESIDWSGFYPNTQRHPGMQQIWSNAAGQLACIHHEGIRHGDMAARNIADTSDKGVFFIDWESALVSHHTPEDAAAKFEISSPDITKLLASMCLPPFARFRHDFIKEEVGIGIFYGKRTDWWKGFKDVFLDEYLDVRRTLAASGNHSTRNVQEVNEELEVLENELKQHVSILEEICDTLPEPKET